MKTKIFTIIGSGTDNLGLNNSPYSILASENLSQYVDLIQIGNPTDGVDITQLKESFAPHITNGSEPLNILLFMHGFFENDQYLLTTYQEAETSSSEVIKTLVEATCGRPLKIFAICCFGANLQNDLILLPVGSFLMTLSDKNQETCSYDYHGAIAASMNEIFMQQEFKIEYLLESYLFTQKFTNNTPIIGVRHDDRLEVTSINDLVKYFFSKEQELKLSEFAKILCKHEIISQDQINSIKDSLFQKGGDSNDLVCRDNIFSLIIKHWKDGSLENFIQTHEDKYYFPGSLKNLKITLEDFNENITPEPLKSFGDVDLSKYCQLHNYITSNNLLEHPLEKELRDLLNLHFMTPEQATRFGELMDNDVHKLCSDYR